jgi:hypothetical protein
MAATHSWHEAFKNGPVATQIYWVERADNGEYQTVRAVSHRHAAELARHYKGLKGGRRFAVQLLGPAGRGGPVVIEL